MGNTARELGVHLEQKLQTAFQDIAHSFTPPNCPPLLCTINPVGKDEHLRIMQLSALCDEDSATERSLSLQERVIANLSDMFVKASISVQISEDGLTVMLPTLDDIERFIGLHTSMEKEGVFAYIPRDKDKLTL